MSVIEGVRDYIMGCPHLEQFAALNIDRTDAEPVNYGISPSGDRTLSRYLDGTAKRQYSFVLYAREMTEADVERLENNQFLEQFGDWISEQNIARNLPKLGEGNFPTAIEAANGFLFELDEDGGRGLYQIQCNLFYTQKRKD